MFLNTMVISAYLYPAPYFIGYKLKTCSMKKIDFFNSLVTFQMLSTFPTPIKPLDHLSFPCFYESIPLWDCGV